MWVFVDVMDVIVDCIVMWCCFWDVMLDCVVCCDSVFEICVISLDMFWLVRLDIVFCDFFEILDFDCKRILFFWSLILIFLILVIK